MTGIIHHRAMRGSLARFRKIVPWRGFERGTLVTFVRDDCISTPCGVSLSVVKPPRISYHYLIVSDARHSMSSTFHLHFENMRLRLSVQCPQPGFLIEDDAKADIHRWNLAPAPAFLQRKLQHSRVRFVSRRLPSA